MTVKIVIEEKLQLNCVQISQTNLTCAHSIAGWQSVSNLCCLNVRRIDKGDNSSTGGSLTFLAGSLCIFLCDSECMNV